MSRGTALATQLEHGANDTSSPTQAFSRSPSVHNMTAFVRVGTEWLYRQATISAHGVYGGAGHFEMHSDRHHITLSTPPTLTLDCNDSSMTLSFQNTPPIQIRVQSRVSLLLLSKALNASAEQIAELKTEIGQGLVAQLRL